MKFYNGRNGKTGFIGIRQFNHHEVIWYSHTFESDAVAGIVSNAIEVGMEKRIEQIRHDAYEAGWSDAKKRRKKRSTFHDCINTDEVGF